MSFVASGTSGGTSIGISTISGTSGVTSNGKSTIASTSGGTSTCRLHSQYFHVTTTFPFIIFRYCRRLTPVSHDRCCHLSHSSHEMALSSYPTFSAQYTQGYSQAITGFVNIIYCVFN
ncbi:hypothetical protein DPMN_086535 [Dreissena polymorpha]|uniref:Uncharacterized protein n=1 Tax=Dreissena polymorpha TaxID=45954 RepID=A0A9D4KRD7_DREPO|nr:hypothetical protein DPMN_086535 [Dreissena polymorpha]